jgi:hypothetical protein
MPTPPNSPRSTTADQVLPEVKHYLPPSSAKIDQTFQEHFQNASKHSKHLADASTQINDAILRVELSKQEADAAMKSIEKASASLSKSIQQTSQWAKIGLFASATVATAAAIFMVTKFANRPK